MAAEHIDIKLQIFERQEQLLSLQASTDQTSRECKNDLVSYDMLHMSYETKSLWRKKKDGSKRISWVASAALKPE